MTCLAPVALLLTHPIFMKAYLFPGQGAQFPGMGRDLYDRSPLARDYFDRADALLNFPLTEVMFNGDEAALRRTDVTQPAVFLHAVAHALSLPDFAPDMVAGHSLGEFSALVAAGSLSFEAGLMLVSQRAQAMQRACEQNPSTMAAVLGLPDEVVESVCATLTDEVVVAANYNCPGQLVISGTHRGIERACELLKAAGAKRALPLPVGGAFHSPLMEPARAQLAQAIADVALNPPRCPVYQNVDARPATRPEQIRRNLVAQLTAPVRWTQSVENMIADGATNFVECGPGKVLQGLVRKINPAVAVAGG